MTPPESAPWDVTIRERLRHAEGNTPPLPRLVRRVGATAGVGIVTYFVALIAGVPAAVEHEWLFVAGATVATVIAAGFDWAFEFATARGDVLADRVRQAAPHLVLSDQDLIIRPTKVLATRPRPTLSDSVWGLVVASRVDTDGLVAQVISYWAGRPMPLAFHCTLGWEDGSIRRVLNKGEEATLTLGSLVPMSPPDEGWAFEPQFSPPKLPSDSFRNLVVGDRRDSPDGQTYDLIGLQLRFFARGDHSPQDCWVVIGGIVGGSGAYGTVVSHPSTMEPGVGQYVLNRSRR